MSDILRILLSSYFLLNAVFMHNCYEPLDEGSACQNLGFPGKCEKVRNCEKALDVLKNKGYHGLKRCGFDAFHEIVCCPDISCGNPIEETTTIEGVIWTGGISKRPSTEGSVCQQQGHLGKCEKVENCKMAIDALKNKGRHELLRCGLEGTQEIVCCPNISDKKPIGEAPILEKVICSGNNGISKRPSTEDNKGLLKKKRKCEKMCEKIYIDNKIVPGIGIHYLIYGENSDLGQFPHAVALGFENSDEQIEWNCGASLISSRFLLTAAHCFVCIGCSNPKKARLGIVDITDSQTAQDVDVKNVTPHPDYDPISKHNDIGIVELVQDVQMSKLVYPACLYTKEDDPLRLQIIGWGQTVSNDRTSKARILQYGIIQPVPVSECNSTIVSKSSKVILETQICAIDRGDTCAGDSGGPLHIKEDAGGYAIVGIVSYGIQCGTKFPGIYTRVAKYLDWIEQMVWPD